MEGTWLSAKHFSDLQVFFVCLPIIVPDTGYNTFEKNDDLPNILVSIYLYKTEFNESASWVSAENLWILGRYMVHLPLEEILKISLNEVSKKKNIYGWIYLCPVMSATNSINNVNLNMNKKFTYLNFLIWFLK